MRVYQARILHLQVRHRVLIVRRANIRVYPSGQHNAIYVQLVHMLLLPVELHVPCAPFMQLRRLRAHRSMRVLATPVLQGQMAAHVRSVLPEHTSK